MLVQRHVCEAEQTTCHGGCFHERVCDHEHSFILAGTERAQACGLMSGITASVQKALTSDAFEHGPCERNLFNTVRSISR